MNRNDRLVSGATLALLLAGTTILARKGAAKTWTRVAHKPPPPEESNHDVDMREALLWAVASGAAVGVARLLVRRFVAYRGSPLDENSRLRPRNLNLMRRRVG